MGMTITEKILAAKCNKLSVKAGELILADVDLAMANDVTAPVAIKEFEKARLDKIFNKDKVAFILDHFTPNKDINSATLCKVTREFAKKHNITHFYEGGNVGIEHALIPELGLALPGELIIGADSHTCTYGALNAFSTGVGSTDMAVAMATGKVWLKVPQAIKITLKGKFRENVCGKDLILHLIGLIGVDGALYKSLEFMGEGVKSLTMDDRFTISNMAIEAGAKNGIFPCDEITLSYISKTASRPYLNYEADKDAKYIREIEIDLSELKATVAFPHLPENTKDIDEAEAMNIKIDQVVIGSCTNGRYSDLYNAAMYLKGKRVCKDVRAIIIPATPKIYKEALMTGLLEIFLDAGCVISAPTCGPCLGGHMGILAKGERAVATTNRNFVGRMGHPESEVYLASPVVAAASAVKGYIAKP